MLSEEERMNRMEEDMEKFIIDLARPATRRDKGYLRCMAILNAMGYHFKRITEGGPVYVNGERMTLSMECMFQGIIRRGGHEIPSGFLTRWY